MSENSSSLTKEGAATAPPAKQHVRWLLLGLPFWVIAGFFGAQIVLAGAFLGLQAIGVEVAGVNQTVFQTGIAALSYIVSLVIVIGLPWWVRKKRTTARDMGLNRLPRWLDIGIIPIVFIIYFICSALLTWLVTSLFSGFDATQAQSVGFSDLTASYQYVLAFITLVIVAPFAEEALFRGYLQGKVRRIAPFWLTAVVTSLAFAALHLPGDGVIQWNVAVDVFMLSILLCLLREKTGSLWASILLHMAKNGLAYYFLFINPIAL